MTWPSLYPSRCILCGQVMSENKWICSKCIQDDVLVSGKICALCGVGVNHCNCGSRKHHYERKIACVYYKDGVRRGISRLKFHRHTMLAAYYGRLMAENVKSKYAKIDFDAIVPVPMNPIKQWMRGYNCTDLLAQEISTINNIPILNDVLHKRFQGKMQKRVPLAKRAANVLDMFYVDCSEKIAGKTLLLSDDVCTSGATLNECAKIGNNNRGYYNVCWRCHAPISSDGNDRCPKCKMFICHKCGACMCNRTRY